MLIWIIVSFLLIIIFGIIGTVNDMSMILSVLCIFVFIILFVVGCFTGLVNIPKTEGTHQGVITAVDLEGVYFRRYEVYLKSSGYTGQSDETKYLIYEDEKEMAETLKSLLGKTVKITYGHDGGYISWNSCGTLHIKSVEVVE